MMKTKNLVLAAMCAAFLLATMGVAWAIGPTDAPDPHKDTQMTRKNGDLFIWYGGRSYRSRSLRPGSTYNRTFRGGGLHGGK